MPLTPERKAKLYKLYGVDPEKFDIVLANENQQLKRSTPPTKLGRGEAAFAVGKRAIAPAIGGILGAAGLAAIPVTGGLSSFLLPVAGALGGGLAAGFGQEKLLQSIQSPEAYQKGVEQIEQARELYPGTTIAAELAPNIIAFNPVRGVTGLAKGLTTAGARGKVLTGAGIGAALGGGIEAGQQKFIEGREDLSIPRVLGAAAGGALFNEPNVIGKALKFKPVLSAAGEVSSPGINVNKPDLGFTRLTDEVGTDVRFPLNRLTDVEEDVGLPIESIYKPADVAPYPAGELPTKVQATLRRSGQLPVRESRTDVPIIGEQAVKTGKVVIPRQEVSSTESLNVPFLRPEETELLKQLIHNRKLTNLLRGREADVFVKGQLEGPFGGGETTAKPPTTEQSSPTTGADAMTKPRASLAAAPVEGQPIPRIISPNELQSVISEFTNRYQNSPKVTIVNDPNLTNEFGQSVEGLYKPDTGEIILNQALLRDRQHAAEVIAEELIGHHGVERVLGGDFVTTVDEIGTKLSNEQLRSVADQYRLDLNNPTQRRDAVVEYVAKRGRLKEDPFYVKLFNAVKQSVKMLFGVEDTADDIIDRIIQSSRVGLRRRSNSVADVNGGGGLHPVTPAVARYALAGEPEPRVANDIITERAARQERSFSFPALRSVLRRIRNINSPAATIVADAADEFYSYQRQYIGKYQTPLLQKISKTVKITNPKDFVINNSKSNDRIQQYLYDMDDFGESKIKLTAEEADIYNSLVKMYIDVRTEQNSLDIPVVETSGRRRAGKFTKNKWFHLTKPSVVKILLETPNSPEALKLKDDFINLKSKMYEELEAENPLGKAQQDFKEIIQAYSQGSEFSNRAEQFGPIDKAEGMGLPPSWREDNLFRSVERYTARVSRRFSFFKAIQAKNEVRAALGIPKDVHGNDTMEVPGLINVSGHPDVALIMKDIAGQHSAAEIKRDAIGRLIRSAMLGFGTGAVDYTNTPILGFQHMGPAQVVKATAHSLVNRKKNLADSFTMGVNRINISSIEFNQHANDIFSGMHRFSDILNSIQGRNFWERNARALAFGMGKFAAMDDLIAIRLNPKLIDKPKNYHTKFLNDFAPKDWRKYLQQGEFPPEVLNEIAAKYTESIQGTYTPQGLPPIALEGSLSPFLSISRWTIEKANNFAEFVITPALNGNFTPLLMSTLGMIVGGKAITELREFLSGHEEKVPKLPEILQAQQEGQDVAAAFFYKAAALADAASYMGIVAGITRMAGDIMYKNNPIGFTNPLIHGVTTSFNNVADIVQAFNEGKLDVGLNMMSQLMEDYFQTYRIGLTALSRFGVADVNERQQDLERAKQFRNLRVFKQLYNYPVAAIGSDFPNRFSGQDIRRYKRTENLGEAGGLLGQEILPRMLEQYGSRPELLRSKLQGLKQNSFQVVPNPEHNPMQAAQYLKFVEDTYGEESRRELVRQYVIQNLVNKEKSKLVPSL